MGSTDGNHLTGRRLRQELLLGAAVLRGLLMETSPRRGSTNVAKVHEPVCFVVFAGWLGGFRRTPPARAGRRKYSF